MINDETPRRIFLVGLMGAGKTTIGRLLAKRLGLQFVDTDQELERRTGVSVATIFEVEGEAAFRAREAELIDELTQHDGIVLATGGGAVLNASSRQALRTRGTTIYLHALPETSYQRLRRNRDRPLLRVEDPLARLRQLYAARHELYSECAHLRIESASGRPASSVNAIVASVSGGRPQPVSIGRG